MRGYLCQGFLRLRFDSLRWAKAKARKHPPPSAGLGLWSTKQLIRDKQRRGVDFTSSSRQVGGVF